jgi:hypothetical protein
VYFYICIIFSVTLSWYDPPAEVGAAKALVNDLDLVLLNPGGGIT